MYNKNVERNKKEFEEVVVQVDRVTRVVAGGKRLRFRATVVIGNRKGKIGIASAKATEVSEAVKKAVVQAEKNIITVPIINDTIPHRLETKFGAVRVMMKPAPKGSGVAAGGAIRILAELAGIKNISSKILGSPNKINNLKVGIKAFESFLDAKKSDSKLIKSEKRLLKGKNVKQSFKNSKKK